MTTPSFARDRTALAVATRLRMDECPHGLPYRVTARETVPPWEPGECTCRPLCDACVMEAVRQEVDTLTAALAAVREALQPIACALANWEARAAELKRELRDDDTLPKGYLPLADCRAARAALGDGRG